MVHEVLVKVRDEKKCSPDSEFTLTASWCDEDQDDLPEKFLFPIQKVCVYVYVARARMHATN